MSNKKRIIISIYCFLLIFTVCVYEQTAYAASKQAEIVTTSVQGDLTVLFTFDKEIVDITFISPSGTKKSSKDSDVEYSFGDLWATYRISDAEAGTWSVEYDLGKNSKINYSIIEDDYGLWIQYLNVGAIENDEVTLTFEADWGSDSIYYNYEVYALSTTDNEIINKVADGNAKSDEEKEIKVRLSGLSSDNYIFKLDVYYQDGGAEVFDSVTSDAFDYSNPNESKAIEDFKVKIDVDNLTCTVDWSDFSKWGYEGYRLVVNADNETIYSGELEKNVTEDGVSFPAGASSLEIKLSYKDRGIWSAEKIKTVSLNDEILSKSTEDVSNSSQVLINYKVNKERLLYVNINGEEGNYKVKEEGELAFDLVEGNNTVYTEIEADDLVSFVIDTSVYYDTNPPEIKLYEDLDGKTFYSDTVTIIGKLSGGNVLRIDGVTVEIGEAGEFSYLVNLSLGENVIEIEAEDANGNATKRALTLYKASSIISGADVKSGWIQFLPLLAAVLTSILIILLSVVFMRKTQKTSESGVHRIWPFILWDILVALTEAGCIWQFISRYLYSNSLNYLELAERSAAEASKHIKLERMFEIASVIGLVILALSILITVLIIMHNKKKRMS